MESPNQIEEQTSSFNGNGLFRSFISTRTNKRRNGNEMKTSEPPISTPGWQLFQRLFSCGDSLER